MSYLDIPRIHFSGRFFTDPSTVNNDPTHYEDGVTTPSPWQNPNGQHRFEFRDCLITSATDANGPVTSDPVIGCPIASIVTVDKAPSGDQSAPPQNPAASSAKIVDIDVYQQGVSEIFGLQLTITVGTVSISGIVDTPSLNMCWVNAVLPTRSWEDSDYDQDSFGGDMNACGSFQSFIRVPVDTWPSSTSAVLNTLRSVTLQENKFYLVSIKFVVDGYRNVPIDQQYQTGRIVGTLGPVFANEPRYNPGQRWMRPRSWQPSDPWNWPSFNDCPFKVDTVRSKLVIDLANSICRASAGGPPVDLGTLSLTAVTPDPVVVELGQLDYSAFSYSNNAQLIEVPLNAGQLSVIQQGTLHVRSSRSDLGNPTILSEPDNKLLFCVEKRTALLEGKVGENIKTTVYVSQNGKPLPNKQLALFVESVHGNTPGATVPPTNPGDTPQAEGALQATISTSDANGFATVTLTVLKDPGSRTPELDGQLYFIIAYDPAKPMRDYSKQPPPPQDRMISCKVFSDFAEIASPAWEDIQAMMAPYMKLYPGMRLRINLTDKHTFTIFSDNPPWVAYGEKPSYKGPLGIQRGAIPYYMSRDKTDPRFMPVSRDLSRPKTNTLMNFIKQLQEQLSNEQKQ